MRSGYSSVTNPRKISTESEDSEMLLYRVSFNAGSCSSTASFVICNGFGDTSSIWPNFDNIPGDAIDIGVFGGRGIGCRGARGERGIDGNAPIPLGDNGGDAMEEDCESPSRGFRGSAVCTPPIGLGLEGSPGLIDRKSVV